MAEQPDYVDAAILIALTWGGDPETVLAATDHLNAGYAEYRDWVHACNLLGRLGLLVPGEPLPSTTQTGEEIVLRYCPPGTPPRKGAMKIRDALAILPIVADPIPTPGLGVINDAIAACEQRRKDHLAHRYNQT